MAPKALPSWQDQYWDDASPLFADLYKALGWSATAKRMVTEAREFLVYLWKNNIIREARLAVIKVLRQASKDVGRPFAQWKVEQDRITDRGKNKRGPPWELLQLIPTTYQLFKVAQQANPEQAWTIKLRQNIFGQEIDALVSAARGMEKNHSSYKWRIRIKASYIFGQWDSFEVRQQVLWLDFTHFQSDKIDKEFKQSTKRFNNFYQHYPEVRDYERTVAALATSARQPQDPPLPHFPPQQAWHPAPPSLLNGNLENPNDWSRSVAGGSGAVPTHGQRQDSQQRPLVMNTHYPHFATNTSHLNPHHVEQRGPSRANVLAASVPSDPNGNMTLAPWQSQASIPPRPVASQHLQRFNFVGPSNAIPYQGHPHYTLPVDAHDLGFHSNFTREKLLLSGLEPYQFEPYQLPRSNSLPINTPHLPMYSYSPSLPLDFSQYSSQASDSRPPQTSFYPNPTQYSHPH